MLIGRLMCDIDWPRRRGAPKDLLRWVLFILDGSHGFHSITSDWPRTEWANRRIASKIEPPNLTETREAEMKTACARTRVRGARRSAASLERSEASPVWKTSSAAGAPIFRQTAQIVQAAQCRKPSLVQGAQARVGALRHPARKVVRL